MSKGTQTHFHIFLKSDSSGPTIKHRKYYNKPSEINLTVFTASSKNVLLEHPLKTLQDLPYFPRENRHCVTSLGLICGMFYCHFMNSRLSLCQILLHCVKTQLNYMFYIMECLIDLCFFCFFDPSHSVGASSNCGTEIPGKSRRPR